MKRLILSLILLAGCLFWAEPVLAAGFSFEVTLDWDTNADYDLYVQRGNQEGSTVYYYNNDIGGFCHDAHPGCNSTAGPECYQENTDRVGESVTTYTIWYNRYSDCGTAPTNINITATVVALDGPISVNGQFLTAGYSRVFRNESIPFIAQSGDVSGASALGFAININPYPQICADDDDCTFWIYGSATAQQRASKCEDIGNNLVIGKQALLVTPNAKCNRITGRCEDLPVECGITELDPSGKTACDGASTIYTKFLYNGCYNSQCRAKSFVSSPDGETFTFNCNVMSNGGTPCRDVVVGDQCPGDKPCFCPASCYSGVGKRTVGRCLGEEWFGEPKCLTQGLIIPSSSKGNPDTAVTSTGCGVGRKVLYNTCVQDVADKDHAVCVQKLSAYWYIPTDLNCGNPDTGFCSCWPTRDPITKLYYRFGTCGGIDLHWSCYSCNGQACSGEISIWRQQIPPANCDNGDYPPWDDQGDGKHLGCNDNNRCILVDGEQPSSCQTDAQCPHKYCEAGRCLLGVGGGPNECADDSECLDPAVTDPDHSECVDKKCKIVKGFEKDSCSVDTDCDGIYSLCKDKKCVQQEGFLPDSCSVDADCYHSACAQDLKCKTVDGEDDDKCTIDADCERTYLDCDNNQCVAVPGDASDACAEDNDCVGDNDNDTTHLICNASQQCEVALGDGADQCQTSLDCISGSHNECSGQTCVSVLGAGINQCNTSANCIGSPRVDELGLGLGGGINAIDGCIEDRPGSMSVVLEWEYFSPEGIRQSQYVFQADDDSDFSSPEVNTFVGSLNNPSGTINSQTLLVNSVPTTPGAGFLAFNTIYHMRARVWDQNNRSSDWREITYKTPVHAYPSPSFHPSLMPILVNEPVVFADGSLCYTSSQQVYFCKDLASNEYTWNFGGQIYSTRGSITHTYTDTGTYSVNLTVCDSLDQCCQVSDDALSVFNDLGEAGFPAGGSGDFPLWKEISPF